MPGTVKIDAFSHVRPRAYAEVVERLVGGAAGRLPGGRALSHPARDQRHPRLHPELDLPGLNVAQVFGWPFDTVIAMTCLIYGGVLDRFPNLTFITHHAGAGIPFFEQRMATHPGQAPQLKKPLLEYYRSFYVDSAIQGSIGGMQASYAFYGADRILFGTDMPYASANGDGNARQCIASIDALSTPPAEKARMFGGNLLRLIGD